MNARDRLLRGAPALFAAMFFIAIGGGALAKLPPPTPEAQAASEQKSAVEKAQLLKEQELLARAQDRASEVFRANMIRQGKVPPAPTPVAQATAMKDMPKTVGTAPRSEGPRGGTAPSAEAHSAPVK